ncbi:glycosyltransferase family 2 protein [Pelagicoccus sp. SDUM812002]|uniref:glycosyltransferase family 2 protein n=1 Tax=Pelagicoccus sp. SDUM812002 TaxID=3041266 RepID=UPI00280EFAD9|nr:glycosyltransferase family 2 protein [Pelagicoccus sp. SDUM812002]MDQ8186291.1 glycosyltransferase family 2 protein [Pelagicoccus sp. SDUM812002]
MKSEKETISASIVAFNNTYEEVKAVVDCLLQSDRVKRIVVIDHSPSIELATISEHCTVKYIHNPSNPGFGAGHNVALNEPERTEDFHLILNPDVSFNLQTIENLCTFAIANPNAGICIPKILNTDGTVQHLLKLLPTPLTFPVRRLPALAAFKHSINQKFELHQIDQKRPSEINVVSGCFAFIKGVAITAGCRFDERFFLYFEDFDLTRQITRTYKAYYVPTATAYHKYGNGSRHSTRLLFVAITSYIRYFNKWGWFLDRDRQLRNKAALNRMATEQTDADAARQDPSSS